MGYTFPRVSKHSPLVKRGISGLGLFAKGPIKRGDFVIEYWGRVVTDEEADKKGGKYLFKVERGKTIDGTTRKNVARYINHSCKPNCKAEMDGTRVFISARRAIQPGEEITYDYGKEYWEDHIGPKRCGCVSCTENRK
ncbi:MAG: SET domain-containing protein-lysine N-methyltransferase [Minisyncoccia bacterium]